MRLICGLSNTWGCDRCGAGSRPEGSYLASKRSSCRVANASWSRFVACKSGSGGALMRSACWLRPGSRSQRCWRDPLGWVCWSRPPSRTSRAGRSSAAEIALRQHMPPLWQNWCVARLDQSRSGRCSHHRRGCGGTTTVSMCGRRVMTAGMISTLTRRRDGCEISRSALVLGFG